MSDLSAIARTLAQVDGPGRPAARVDLAAMGLSLEVDGVGRCRLPLRPEQAAGLLAASAPSPFGYRDQTLHDPEVRAARELPASAVRLSDGWGRRLDRGLQQLRAALGLPEGVEIRATLQKLVIYEPGGFFRPHRDTERAADMWGSLVVVLPCAHEGGELVVRHGGEEQRFDASAAAGERQLAFIGFYADCVHEICPVRSGLRVALTFSLHGEVAPLVAAGGGEEALRSALSEHLDAVEWLVLLLDHSYTRQRFSWEALKLQDGHRARLLRELAPEVGGAAFLAFAEVCDFFEYDEDEPAEGSRDGFGPRVGGELTLSDWRDAAGRPCVGTDEGADDDCIVSLVPPMDRQPYQVEAEPWTGNEGGTAFQWYRQAAVVVVHEDSELYEEIAAPRPSAPPPTARRVVRRRRRD